MNGSTAQPVLESPTSARSSPRPPAADSRSREKRIQELIEQIELLPDPAARDLFQECLQSSLALYGEGLARILQLAKNAGDDGKPWFDAVLKDRLVSGLLLVHGLHPLSLQQRLDAALAKIRPYLQSHGGNVEVLSLQNDVARLRLQGTCRSCPSSSITLELAVRQVIEEACPDLAGFEVDGALPPAEQTAVVGPCIAEGESA